MLNYWVRLLRFVRGCENLGQSFRKWQMGADLLSLGNTWEGNSNKCKPFSPTQYNHLVNLFTKNILDSPIKLLRNVAKITSVVVAPNVQELVNPPTPLSCFIIDGALSR